MSELPEGWQASNIESISLPIETVDPKKSPEKEFRYIDIGSIDNSTHKITEPKTFKGADAPSRARRIVHSNDTVFSTVRTYLKNIAKVPIELDNQLASTGIAVIRPANGVDENFLFRWMCNDEFVNTVSESQDGALYPAVKDSDVAAGPILLPPQNEQTRIANKIDALFARSGKAKKGLDAIPSLLDQYHQSVLVAAFRGDLTKDWRKRNPDVEPANKLLTRIRNQRRKKWEKSEFSKMMAKGKEPKNDKWKERYLGEPEIWKNIEWDLPQDWKIVSLGTLLNKIQAGKSFKCEERPPEGNEKGIVKVSAVTSGEFNQKESKTVLDEKRLIEKSKIAAGDFLFSRANTIELVGACAIVNELGKDLYLSDKILRLEFVLDLKVFLKWFLRSNEGRVQIEALATGNQQSMRNIGQASLQSIAVPIPPLDEIKELCKILDHIDNRRKATLDISNDVLQELDKLNQSVLDKAFRGGLVPQNPNDEPASILLKRIKIERAEITKSIKSNKRESRIRKIGEIKKMIIPVIEALKNENIPLTAQDLLTKAGYPHDATTSQVEPFFLDIRDALRTKKIKHSRVGDEDVFELAG